MLFEVGANIGEDRYEALGGVAANTSVGLARLGIRSHAMVRRAMMIYLSGFVRNSIRRGVDTEFTDEEYTRVKAIFRRYWVLTGDGERTIFTIAIQPSVLGAVVPKFSGASWVISAADGNWGRKYATGRRGRMRAKLAVNPVSKT